MTGQPSLPITPAGADRRDQRWRVRAVCLALAVITFAVFGRTLTHQFINFDDNDYVYENPVVIQGLTLKGVVWAFTGAHSANWHPLTWLSHELDCQLYGLNPAGHHLTNVLLHAATVIALFLVLRQMTGALWRSAFVAAVFAIHPLRVESVAWVAERKDVLSGLFFMLTIGAYVRYARLLSSANHNPNPNPNLNLLSRPYLLVLLLFALGLMCKPMLVTLPVVLLLLDYWPLRRAEPRKLSALALEKLPLLALSAAACVATMVAQKEALYEAAKFTLPDRLGNALASCAVYLGQMVWPAGLAVLYPFPRHGVPGWELALAGTLLAGLSAVAWTQRRARPWLLVGWLWYLVMLLPVLGLIQVGLQAHADRYTYLPQIGIYVAVTWLVAELMLGRVAFAGLMGGVLAALMVCAWNQAGYWRDSDTLLTRTLACTTDNDVVQNNFGTLLMQEGNFDEATLHFRKALEIRPDSALAHGNYGLTLFQQGRVDQAISQYEKALQLKPNFAKAHYNLGNALLQKGKEAEALAHFQQALQIEPDNPWTQTSLAFLLAAGSQPSLRNGARALELARQANETTAGEVPTILRTLAAALAAVGRFPEAVETSQRALDFATVQSQTGLAGQIQSEMKLYQAGKPFHIPEQVH